MFFRVSIVKIEGVLMYFYSRLRRWAKARDLSYTPSPTGEKHTISTFVDLTRMQRTRQRRKNIFFKTSLQVFSLSTT